MSSATTLAPLSLASASSPEKAASEWARQSKAALTRGDYLEARELVAQGLKMFPGDASLQRLSTLLAPPKVRIRPNETTENVPIGPTLSSQQKNQQWLRQHGADYQEKWVAVNDGNLLGAASSIQELRDCCGDLSDSLVTKIF